MKKILFVINTLGQAGAETALVELLKRLDEKEYDISLYVLMGQGEMIHALPDYVHVLNKKFCDKSVLSKEGQGNMKKTVMKAMLRRATWLMDFSYLVKHFFGMVVKKQLKMDKLLWRVLSDGADRFETKYDLAVAYLEGGATYYVADHVNALKKAAFVHVDYGQAGYSRSLDKNCYLKYDSVYTVSEEVKKAFLTYYPECTEQTGIFHNLLNKDLILEKSGEFKAYEDTFEGFRIATVGRLTTQKAFEVSIEAMALLKEKGEKVKWYVYGEGDQRKKLEDLIKSKNLTEDFILCGAVPNPYPYMKAADIYVHCSRFEGKSIAIQEAQILGKAILVSDCSGNREQVIPGVDGLMCDLLPQDICDNIVKLIHDEEMRSRLGAAAAKKNEAEESPLMELLSEI